MYVLTSYRYDVLSVVKKKLCYFEIVMQFINWMMNYNDKFQGVLAREKYATIYLTKHA